MCACAFSHGLVIHKVHDYVCDRLSGCKGYDEVTHKNYSYWWFNNIINVELTYKDAHNTTNKMYGHACGNIWMYNFNMYCIYTCHVCDVVSHLQNQQNNELSGGAIRIHVRRPFHSSPYLLTSDNKSIGYEQINYMVNKTSEIYNCSVAKVMTHAV